VNLSRLFIEIPPSSKLVCSSPSHLTSYIRYHRPQTSVRFQVPVSFGVKDRVPRPTPEFTGPCDVGLFQIRSRPPDLDPPKRQFFYMGDKRTPLPSPVLSAFDLLTPPPSCVYDVFFLGRSYRLLNFSLSSAASHITPPPENDNFPPSRRLHPQISFDPLFPPHELKVCCLRAGYEAAYYFHSGCVSRHGPGERAVIESRL